jgi:hypothetical protein
MKVSLSAEKSKNRKTLYILEGAMTFRRITLSIMALCMIKPVFRTLSIATISKMTLILMTPSTVTHRYDNYSNETLHNMQHFNTQPNDTKHISHSAQNTQHNIMMNVLCSALFMLTIIIKPIMLNIIILSVVALYFDRNDIK